MGSAKFSRFWLKSHKNTHINEMFETAYTKGEAGAADGVDLCALARCSSLLGSAHISAVIYTLGGLEGKCKHTQ